MKGSNHGQRRVLVLGATGMAGHVVSTYLAESGLGVVRAGRGQVRDGWLSLDVLRDEDLAVAVREGGFDAVVNCVGALVADSSAHPERAVALNAHLPHRLAALTSGLKTRVVHLSTDCVFSGTTGSYVESSFRDGDSVYDRAKALGELDNDKDLTLRMSIIGPEIRTAGTGLMHWFLGRTGAVVGFQRAMWNGVTTLELAKSVAATLDSDLTGLYHLVPDDRISKHDLLVLIRDAFGRADISLVPDASVVIDKTLVDTRRSFPRTVGANGYPGMVEEMRDWVEDHPDLYAPQPRYAVRRPAGGLP